MITIRQLPAGYYSPGHRQAPMNLAGIDLVHVRVVGHAYDKYHTVRCKAVGHEYPVSREQIRNRHAKGLPLKCRDCGGRK